MADAWLDDTLPADDRQGLEEHLATCDACRSTIDALRCTRRRPHQHSSTHMPLFMKQRLLDELRTLREHGA